MDNHNGKICEALKESILFAADNIKNISANIPENTPIFINKIENAKTNRIFLIGTGRSGYEARSFATRLTNLGFNARIMCDTTIPIPGKNDLLIVISGYGNVKPITNLINCIDSTKIITITTKKDSEIGNISDMVIIMPIDLGQNKKIFSMGTIFEIIMHIFLESVIAELKVRSIKLMPEN